MKLSFAARFLIGRYGHEKAFSLIKEAGFDALDYSLESMVDSQYLLCQDDWREQAENIRRMADEAGLVINQTHSPFAFGAKRLSDEVVFRGEIMPALHRALEISAIFGAKTSVVHPLHYLVYQGHEEEIFEKNMAFFKELIPSAQANHVKIAIENMYQRDQRRKCIVHDTCSRSAEHIRYVDTLDSEYVVACLDIGHVGLIQRDDEAWDAIRALGHDRLQSLHVHDNDYCGDLHMLPYTGKINWTEVTRALGEIDYQGDFTYETAGAFLNTMDDELMPEGIKFMNTVGRHLMKLIDRNRPQA